ncbi:hypothetical protein, partial [Novacetimonas hansenii]|uniref:hypothetical protein n=1 Tax=Novacetimonas hansenii TaxID=436 RepID=UPI001C37AF9E
YALWLFYEETAMPPVSFLALFSYGLVNEKPVTNHPLHTLSQMGGGGRDHGGSCWLLIAQTL